MKLHLPKMLLTAVLAAVTLAPAAMALSITGAVTGSGYTLGDTALTNAKAYRNGQWITFSYDGAGTVSGVSFDSTTLTFTFNLDLDQAAKASNFTDKSALNAGTATDPSYIVYVSNGDAQWGLRLYDGAYTENSVSYDADGVPEIVGHWKDDDMMYKQDSNAVTLSELGYSANGGTEQTAAVTATIADTNPSGVALYKGTGVVENNKVYHQYDLLTTTDSITSIVFNKNYASSITLADIYSKMTVGNSAETWSHDFDISTTSFLEGNGKHEVNNINNKKDHLASKDIVVGSTTQLFLQSWGNGKDLDVLSNIYVGSTTYTEDKAGSTHNNAALRFGNDDKVDGGQITTLKGNIYIVEDTKFSSETTKIKNINGVNTTLTPSAINFEGDVTDVVDGVDTNSTLTIRGEGYVFKGAVDLSGLVLQSGSAATFSSTSATIGALTTGGTVTNTGSLAVTGTLNLQNAITNSGSLNLSGTTIEIGGHTSLFSKAENDVAGNGFLSGTATVYTNSGDSATVSAEIAGVTYGGVTLTADKYTLSDGVLTGNDSDTYWIFNDTDYSKISSAVSSDANKTVRVTAGKTYDLKGTAAYNKVVLEAGATLDNTGNDIGDEIVDGTTYNYCKEKQNYYIELAGDANMSATGSYAMVANSDECSTLKLNGHTLTKKGTGTVVLNSTVADAGTIAITAGKIWLNEYNDDKKSDLDEVAFTMSSGTTLRSIDSMTIKSLSSSGGSITVDSGKKLTVEGKFSVSAGTTQLSGSLKASDLGFASGGKLTLSNATTVLDLTGKTFADDSVPANMELVRLIRNTSGAGTVKLASGSVIQTAGNDRPANSTESNDVTIATNYVAGESAGANASLVLTSWKNESGDKWRTWTVTDGGSITVGGGAGELNVRAGQQLEIQTGGIVNVGTLKLGHPLKQNPGSIVMTGGKLTVSTIYGYTEADDAATPFDNMVSITGGTLKVTGTNALSVRTNSVTEGGTTYSIAAKMNATIGGSGNTAVTLQTASNDWVLSGDDDSLNGGTLTVGNIIIDAENTKMITISDATISGVITNNATAATAGLTLGDNVTVNGEVKVKGSGTMKMSSLSGTVKVTESAKVQYQNGAVQVAAKSAEGTASVTSAAIADAAVTVGGTADVTLAQALSNADLSYTGANKLTVTGEGSSLSSLTAQGNVDIMSAAAAQQLDAITIGAGKTVGIYTGDEAEAITSSESTITTGSLTAGVDSVLNANLVLSDGATLNLDGALTMGSTLTLGTGIMLDADTLASINALKAGDSPVTLFEGVDSLVLGTADYTGEVAFSTHFADVNNNDVYLGYDGRNVFAGIQSVPEPTTATLSLLALAGLAARRRRK